MVLTWDEWLRRLRHDLLKRVLWPARDRRDMGGAVAPGELVVTLVDDEGTPATADAIWRSFRQAAPVPGHPAFVAFGQALARATTAARQDDLATVLALEPAFEQLTRDLARKDR